MFLLMLLRVAFVSISLHVFVCVCISESVFVCMCVRACGKKNRKKITLDQSSGRGKRGRKSSRAHTFQNKLSLSRSPWSVILDEQTQLKPDNGILPTLLFVLLMQLACFVLFLLYDRSFFCFCFLVSTNQTSEIDLPRISLVCFFVFILICLHSSYNIYKTSQKYKLIFFLLEKYTIGS